MAVDGKKGRAGGGMMPSRGPVPRIVNGRTSYSGYPDGPYMLPHQNPPPSGTRSGPGHGGYADGGNYAPSSGYPTQSNMPPAGPRGPHAGMYHGGHLEYNSEEGTRRAVVDLVKSIDGHHQVMWMGRRGDRVVG
nr:UBP1-associated protein 2C-like [Tanacetum cinerariifolium]